MPAEIYGACRREAPAEMVRIWERLRVHRSACTQTGETTPTRTERVCQVSTHNCHGRGSRSAVAARSSSQNAAASYT